MSAIEVGKTAHRAFWRLVSWVQYVLFAAITTCALAAYLLAWRTDPIEWRFALVDTGFSILGVSQILALLCIVGVLWCFGLDARESDSKMRAAGWRCLLGIVLVPIGYVALAMANSMTS